MYFEDRIDAGEKLARKLLKYKNDTDVIVIGLPRGGVPVAFEVSQTLNAPLDIVCPRKIGAPMNKEYAIGAITETGEGILNQNVIEQMHIPQSYLDEEIAAQKKEARHRLDAYRSGMPPRNLSNHTVIIIDDGLATGSTMKAAIRSIKSEGAKKVIVAVPVAPPDSIEEIGKLVDEIICLEAPVFFQAVGQFYSDFSPTEDDEVIQLLKLASA